MPWHSFRVRPFRPAAFAIVRSLLASPIVAHYAVLASAWEPPPRRFIERGNDTSQSVAVVVDGCDLVHTTQLGPLDATGALVGKDDPEEQITQTLDNLRAALTAGGSG